MKVMNRNKTIVYYCKYLDEKDIVDKNGYRTGEKSVMYSDPIPMRCNVAKHTGDAQIAVFSNLPSYDRLIVFDDPHLDIDESTVFFVDKAPEYKGDIPVYDYVVKRVAPSLNSISIALSKVRTS